MELSLVAITHGRMYNYNHAPKKGLSDFGKEAATFFAVSSFSSTNES